MGAKPGEWWVGIELGMGQVEMGAICGNAMASKHKPLAFIYYRELTNRFESLMLTRCENANVIVGQRSNYLNILHCYSCFQIPHACICMLTFLPPGFWSAGNKDIWTVAWRRVVPVGSVLLTSFIFA